jgi:hypothetical protein
MTNSSRRSLDLAKIFARARRREWAYRRILAYSGI